MSYEGVDDRETLEESFNSVSMTGNTDASILQLRLNTAVEIENFEMFLRGQKLIRQRINDTGEIIEVMKEGIPLCNEKGVHSILTKLQVVFNAQIVQGNFDTDMFFYFLRTARLSLNDEIHLNRSRWGINIKDITIIKSMYLLTLYGFMSRLLGNKERESYHQSLQYQQTAQQLPEQKKRGFFGLFRGR